MRDIDQHADLRRIPADSRARRTLEGTGQFPHLHQETAMDTDLDLLDQLELRALSGDPVAYAAWQDALASGVGTDLTPVLLTK
jgi:hypothetical protein